jgi:uncharacterized protein (TIGR03067 family)
MGGRMASVLLAGCLLAFATQSAGQQKGDAMSLQGTWTCVSAMIDGKPLAEETAKQLKLTMTADCFKTERGEQTLFDSTYTIDPAKLPPAIDMIGTEGELKGKPALGIYKLDANQLTLCYVMPGSPRPTTFESQPQSGAFLVVWKRAEK